MVAWEPRSPEQELALTISFGITFHNSWFQGLRTEERWDSVIKIFHKSLCFIAMIFSVVRILTTVNIAHEIPRIAPFQLLAPIWTRNSLPRPKTILVVKIKDVLKEPLQVI